MSLPAFVKTWSFSLNNATGAFVSLVDTVSQVLYGMKNFLVATMGSTVWGSCDGTTGDNTDRWASKANVVTRGASTAAANSWCVFTWSGGQVCLSYVGATDDIARMSFSFGSKFTLAGTPTNTPTATDEVVFFATSLINATATLQRVWSVIAASDRSIFRGVVYRNSVMVECFGVENFAPALNQPNITPGLIIGWNSNLSVGTSFLTGGAAGGANSGTLGAVNTFVSWLGSALKACFGGTAMFNGATTWNTVFNTITPELNGAGPMFPILIGSAGAGAQGWLGTRYDAYFAYGNANALGDYLDDVAANTRLLWAGATMMWPWQRGTALVTA